MASDEQDAGAELKVGQRVKSMNPEQTSQVGTVRYIGPVDGHAGVWIGVDWDNGLGRHNGSVNGRHYFDTSEEQSGSLVRPHALDSGMTMSDALLCRYNASGSLKDQSEDGMYVLSVRHRRMAVELVGKAQIEARQKQLQYLQVCSLAYAGVRSPGPVGEIRALVPNIKELDLTGNLLPDWVAVGNLCTELLSLEILNLSWSRLRIVSGIVPKQPFNIKTLVLNYCQIAWEEVEQLKGCLNTVEELHLCGNKIQAIGGPIGQNGSSSTGAYIQGFESLRLLNLEGNCIESWREIMKLSKLKSLEHLNLTSNCIQEIVKPELFSELSASDSVNQEETGDKALRPPLHFASLRCILLANNGIADWASVDALDRFPALQDLRLSGNPLTVPATGGAPRFMIIARLQKITTLNGSEIRPRERRDAEIRYVRYIASNLAGRPIEELEKLHPRLMELRRTYDVPLETAQLVGDHTSQRMSDTLLTVNIRCVSSSVGERPPITRKLPAATTVGKLKQICEAFFKLKASKQSLYIKDQDPLPVALDSDSVTLDDLGLGADAVILVDDAPT